MTDSKPWYLSRTIWAAIVTIVTAILGLFGVPLEGFDEAGFCRCAAAGGGGRGRRRSADGKVVRAIADRVSGGRSPTSPLDWLL